MSSKKHLSNQFFIKCFPVYSIYVHLTFLYIFGTKLSRENEKISHFWRADVKIPSFTFGEYVGSTLSIRGWPCTLLNLQNWRSPNLILCSPTKYVWVQISYLAQPTKLTKSQSHTMLNHQIWLSIESHTQLNLQNWQSLNLILCSPTKYEEVLISYFAQPQDHCPHTPLNCSSVTHFIPHHLPIAHTCSYLVAHQSSAFWVWNRCCPPGAHMFPNTSFSFGWSARLDSLYSCNSY